MIVTISETLAQMVANGDTSALSDLRRHIARQLGGDRILPYPDPPRLTIFRDGDFEVEFYDENLVRRLGAAIDATLRHQPIAHTPPPKRRKTHR